MSIGIKTSIENWLIEQYHISVTGCNISCDCNNDVNNKYTGFSNMSKTEEYN